MKTWEFRASLGPDATIPVPGELKDEIPQDRPLQVIVLLPEPDEEVGWQRLTTEQFLEGYSESDSVYDSL